MGKMTKRQRAMARHALGLPNGMARSYRNRYVTHYAPGPYDDWAAMEEKGLAFTNGPIGSAAVFYLTTKGAKQALESGETLDPEDFPDA